MEEENESPSPLARAADLLLRFPHKKTPLTLVVAATGLGTLLYSLARSSSSAAANPLALSPSGVMQGLMFQFLTTNVVETELGGGMVKIVAFVSISRELELAVGTAELAKFFGAVGFVSAFLSVSFLFVMYASTYREEYFSYSAHGLAGLISAALVGLVRLEDESRPLVRVVKQQRVVLFPAILCYGGVQFFSITPSSTPWHDGLLATISFLVGIRYLIWSANAFLGVAAHDVNASPAFTFETFFPESLHPLVRRLVARLCGLSSSSSSSSASANGGESGGSGLNKTLTMSAVSQNSVSERRRQRGLDALFDRLAKIEQEEAKVVGTEEVGKSNSSSV